MKKLIVALAATIAAAGAAQAQTNLMDANAYSPRPYVGIAVSGAKNQASDDWRASPKVFGGYDISDITLEKKVENLIAAGVLPARPAAAVADRRSSRLSRRVESSARWNGLVR